MSRTRDIQFFRKKKYGHDKCEKYGHKEIKIEKNDFKTRHKKPRRA